MWRVSPDTVRAMRVALSRVASKSAVHQQANFPSALRTLDAHVNLLTSFVHRSSPSNFWLSRDLLCNTPLLPTLLQPANRLQRLVKVGGILADADSDLGRVEVNRQRCARQKDSTYSLRPWKGDGRALGLSWSPYRSSSPNSFIDRQLPDLDFAPVTGTDVTSRCVKGEPWGSTERHSSTLGHRDQSNLGRRQTRRLLSA
jgi:hypothetical protein